MEKFPPKPDLRTEARKAILFMITVQTLLTMIPIFFSKCPFANQTWTRVKYAIGLMTNPNVVEDLIIESNTLMK